jgi:DNA recombination protein RmuC
VTVVDLPLLAYLALAGLVGLVLGLLIGALRAARLRAALQVKDVELGDRARLDTERDQALALASERLGAVFGKLANEHLRSHTETFLKLARASLGTHHERAKGELAAREQAVEQLVRPIREALARTELQLQELEKTRREAHGSITAQLEAMAMSHQALSAETRNLVTALRRPEVRGQWGEITLRRLVELAGMVEHCDFIAQSHHVTVEGAAIRPDMLVNLPEGRQMIVDVKTPLDAYLDAAQAADEPTRRAALQRHAARVAERVRELAAKGYWAQFERSPEFVILFIPGDQILSAALSQRPELLDEALSQQVILATPTSLVALLKAVAYGWQQAALADHAAEIRSLAVQLYERLGGFAGHLAQLGKELGDGVKAYNRAVGSLERMVLPSARRFTELGVTPRERVATLKPVDDLPRELGTAASADADPDPGEPPVRSNRGGE